MTTRRPFHPAAALLAAAVFVSAGSGRAADPAPDLALVPGDAAGFVHVRLADLWKHDLMSGLRSAITAAGPKALAAFEKQVYPDPATLERATLIVLPPAGQREPPVVGVVAFREAFDKDKLRKLYLPKAAEAKAGGKVYFADRKDDVALAFPDDKHLLIGPVDAVAAFLARPPVADGPMTPAIKLAATGKAIVAALNVKALPIPPRAFDEVPENLRPLVRAERVTLTIDLTGDAVVDLRAAFAGADAAADAETALKAAAGMAAKQFFAQPRAEVEKRLYERADQGPRPLKDIPELAGALFAIGGLNQIDALLDSPPVKRAGAELALTVTLPKEMTTFGGTYTAVAIGLLLPAVQKVREAAARTQGMSNLKQMGLAFYNYNDTYGKLPTDAIYDKAGKPLLSWRVAILPFIDQDNLYKQFKLDEPWDSDHNKKLIPLMPKIYTCPRIVPVEGKTVYKVFTGRNTPFDGPRAGRIPATFPDGTSNTILVVEGGEPVIWTKPDDIPFDPTKPLPKLELPGGVKQISILLGDASVRILDLDRVSEKTLKLAIQPNDGFPLGEDW